MLFKAPELSAQFDALHPVTKGKLYALDEFIKEKDWPGMTITHVLRTPAEQEEIYWKRIASQFALFEKEARAKARQKFSWHLVGCAADVRNKLYTAEQCKAIMAFLQKDIKSPHKWEILEHDVGRGEHFHIGYCDEEWRKNWATKNKA